MGWGRGPQGQKNGTLKTEITVSYFKRQYF